MEDSKYKTSISSPENNPKTNLLGLTKAEIKLLLNKINLPNFRTSQIWNWIYRSGTVDFNEMTNISKDLRSLLSQNFNIWRPKISSTHQSQDGTIKWLLKLDDEMKLKLYGYLMKKEALFVFPVKLVAR